MNLLIDQVFTKILSLRYFVSIILEMVLFYLIGQKTVANLKRNRIEWKNIGMKKKESMSKFDK